MTSASPRQTGEGFLIETERCGLRELRAEDIDALFALYEPPEITRYTAPLFDREEEIEYQANYRNNIYRVYGFGMWLVCDKNTGDVIGRAGVEYRPDENGDIRFDTVEMGYVIDVAWQGRGIAGEVCRALVDYACHELGMSEVTARVNPANTPSVRVAEKCGLRPTGKFVEDEEVYSLQFPGNM